MKNKILTIIVIALILGLTIVLSTNQYAANNTAKKLQIGDRISFFVGKLGDVNLNFKIDEKDAELILKYSLGKKYLTINARKRADVNQDGKINTSDALSIYQYIDGNNTQIPVPTPTPAPTVVNVSSIQITGKTTMKIGETQNLKVTINPSNATNKNVVYTTSNKNIATVNSSTGLVTAINSGKVIITAKLDGKSASIEINVEKIEAKVTINKKDKCPTTLNNKSNGFWTVWFKGENIDPILEEINMDKKGYKCSGAVALYYANYILGNNPNANLITTSYVQNDGYSTNFTAGGYTYTNQIGSYNDEIKKICNEILKGYSVPVAVRNKDGVGLYVLAIAIKGSAMEKGEITPNDIAVIDTKTGGWFRLGDYYQYTLVDSKTKKINQVFALATKNVTQQTTNNNYKYEFGGYTFKTAVTKDAIDRTLKQIKDNNVCQSKSSALRGRCWNVANYHIKMLFGKANGTASKETIKAATLNDTNTYIKTDTSSKNLVNLKNAIDNKKLINLHVYHHWTENGKYKESQHWVTVVGYKGEGKNLGDYLILGSASGVLARLGQTQETNDGRHSDCEMDVIQLK